MNFLNTDQEFFQDFPNQYFKARNKINKSLNSKKSQDRQVFQQSQEVKYKQTKILQKSDFNITSKHPIFVPYKQERNGLNQLVPTNNNTQKSHYSSSSQQKKTNQMLLKQNLTKNSQIYESDHWNLRLKSTAIITFDKKPQLISCFTQRSNFRSSTLSQKFIFPSVIFQEENNNNLNSKNKKIKSKQYIVQIIQPFQKLQQNENQLQNRISNIQSQQNQFLNLINFKKKLKGDAQEVLKIKQNLAKKQKNYHVVSNKDQIQKLSDLNYHKIQQPIDFLINEHQQPLSGNNLQEHIKNIQQIINYSYKYDQAKNLKQKPVLSID